MLCFVSFKAQLSWFLLNESYGLNTADFGFVATKTPIEDICYTYVYTVHG